VREVPIYDARQSLGQLVDEVNASGEAVAVTRHGRRVAVLIPVPVLVPTARPDQSID
jgi:prevent-host-death family protein